VALWPVRDPETSLLMKAFYTGMRDGLSKAVALQAAQQHVRDLTITEVIAYCESIRPSAEASHLAIARSIAELRVRASDVAGAVRDYEEILRQLSPTALGRAGLATFLATLKDVPPGTFTPDYGRRPFDMPICWAPFTLVGDWH
ncbi:MAG TPA: CHAT domain-containing protein, partial [Pseudonocardiaceae bacterium]|nr:CHAT domain-containing protein [Pseudonocardiaceae bacterium]